jgi:hypothetical protein
MKMNPFIKYFILVLCLCCAVNLEAQQKAAKSKKSKRTKFVTPTPIPPDEVKTTFKTLSHVFIWQPEKDTNLPPSFLYREVLEMQTDTVVIKRFYTKKPMEYQTNFYIDYGANEDNEIYVVKTEKAITPFTMKRFPFGMLLQKDMINTKFQQMTTWWVLENLST